MNRRWEMTTLLLFLAICLLLEVSIVLALIGIWKWWLAAIYAVINAWFTLTIFSEYGWCKKIALVASLEAIQILLCAIPLGLRAMF